MTTLPRRTPFTPLSSTRFDRVVDTVINPHRRVSGAANGIRRGESPALPAPTPGAQSLDGLIYLARLIRGQG